MKPIGTLMFPLILGACVAGAIMLSIGLFVVNIFKCFRAIPEVMRAMYGEAK